MKKKNILVITPVKHIMGVYNELKKIGNIIYLPDPKLNELLKIKKDINIIFTNPNKSKIFIGSQVFKKFKNLETICTASTGTVHIDEELALQKKIKVISLKKEIKIIKRISSTAELSFALMISAIRSIPEANKSVNKGEWDYEKFIGRQLNSLKIGVVGYGRLGKLFTKYCLAFGAQLVLYDPYVKKNNKKILQVNSLEKLFTLSDIVALHVHVTGETRGMINSKILNKSHKKIIIVNTSRGELINEKDMIKFLKKNKKAKYYTDVLSDEVLRMHDNKLLKYSNTLMGQKQVFITPHIGGMTNEAQEIAYNHAVKLLKKNLNNSKIK